MHSKYILTLILENSHIFYVTSTIFYEEGYVKFLVFKNRSNFWFLDILKFCLINMFKLMGGWSTCNFKNTFPISTR